MRSHKSLLVLSLCLLALTAYYKCFSRTSSVSSDLLSASSTLGSEDVARHFAEQCPCANIRSNYVTSEVVESYVIL